MDCEYLHAFHGPAVSSHSFPTTGLTFVAVCPRTSYPVLLSNGSRPRHDRTGKPDTERLDANRIDAELISHSTFPDLYTCEGYNRQWQCQRESWATQRKDMRIKTVASMAGAVIAIHES